VPVAHEAVGVTEIGRHHVERIRGGEHDQLGLRREARDVGLESASHHQAESVDRGAERAARLLRARERAIQRR
jgi:hypothetical protein